MDERDPFGPSDPLGRALHLLRMDGAFYCRSHLTAPWGFTLPEMPGYLWFHVVVNGTATIQGGEDVVLAAGDIALVTTGAGHVLRDDPTAAVPDILTLEREELSDRYEVLRHGGGGSPATLLCGAVRLQHPSARDLVRALPGTIVVRAHEPESEWIQSTLRLLALEARQLQPGGEAVITRLADVIVIQAIRGWIRSASAARSGWLGGLRDPLIGQAIAMVHEQPAHAWTVESLAREVAMSRSAFSARFTELVGEPVMTYVGRWRMHVAHATLEDGHHTVAQVADTLGYRSEAAFSRAFKRTLGTSPGAVRRAATAPPSMLSTR